MSIGRAKAQGPARLDQVRAWLGVVAALAAVAAKLAGKAGVVTVGVVTLLQFLNLKLWRRDSVALEHGRDRFALPLGTTTAPRVTRAKPVFLLEELAWLGTVLWWLVLGCWASGFPVHPLMYSAMLLLVGLVVLQQLFPQLRLRRAPAPQRPIVRPPPQSLH